MLMTAIVLFEAACTIATIVLATLWTRDSGGPYEPYIALCAAFAVGVDLFRRYLRSRKLRIFLSVGATYTKEQENYVKEFELFLAAHNIDRLVVGRDQPTSRQPILQVKDLIKKCDAVVVLAFTRYIISSGIKKPGADLPKHTQSEIRDERHPTVWNQIEAGIAFGLGKPLFVVLEDGMKQEAMLKDRLEFGTITGPIQIGFFQTEEFVGRFLDFAAIAKRRSWLQL